MSRAPQRRSRKGFLLLTLLVTMAIVLLFTLIVTRYAVLEFSRDRQAALEACATQLVESARAWTSVHPGWLSEDAPCQLPLETLLPPGYSGEIELQRTRSADGHALVLCRVMLQRAGRGLHQQAEWPLASTPPIP